jgi:hypothetical protein
VPQPAATRGPRLGVVRHPLAGLLKPERLVPENALDDLRLHAEPLTHAPVRLVGGGVLGLPPPVPLVRTMATPTSTPGRPHP